VVGKIGVRDQRADAQATLRRLLNRVERQPRDVDQPQRALDIVFHQIDEVGTAGNELCRWIGRDLPHGIGDIGGAGILKIDHDRPLIAVIACSIAATMFG
jgi:hypothetical protein